MIDFVIFSVSVLPFVIVLLFIGIYISLFITSRIAIIGLLAEIEQLREDINKIDHNISHEIISQATKFNQQIKSSQAYRLKWLFKPLFPAAWDKIKLIEIPKNIS